MSYKRLLFPVQGTPISHQALPHVVAFAEALGADLTGVAARAPVFLADPWIMSGDIVQQLEDVDQDQFKDAEARFKAASAGLGAAAHWCVRRDFPNTAVNLEAAGADLIVSTHEKGPEACTVGVSTLVLEAGIPVLVLPNPARAISANSIIVAWRNTADARRAVTAAMPLLERAKSVTVLQVARQEDAEDGRAGLRAVAQRLKSNGIDAETDLIVRTGEPDATALLNAARERKADMIVCGAYGHPRAREWILGGVTHDLLASTPVPLFMVH